MVDSLFLEVSLLDEQFARSVEHLLSSVVTQSLDGIDNPLVNLIAELIEVDILIGLTLVNHTEYVDSVLCQHRSQFDVHTTLTDSQRNLLGLQVNLGLVVSLVECNAGNLCRREGTLDKQLHVAGVVDHINVLTTKLTNDTVYTTTLHTYTSAYGVNTVVEALNSNLSTLTWHTSHTTDSDQAISDLRHLSLKQTLQEVGTGTAQHDTRIIVLVLHLLHNGTHGLTLTIGVRRNLVALHQVELVTLIVHEEHFALPHLVNLTADNGTHLILVLLIEGIMIEFQDLRSQCLTQVQDSTTTELGEVNSLTHLLAYLVVGLNLLSFGK